MAAPVGSGAILQEKGTYVANDYKQQFFNAQPLDGKSYIFFLAEFSHDYCSESQVGLRKEECGRFTV
jgi:hypothetical protein